VARCSVRAWPGIEAQLQTVGWGRYGEYYANPEVARVRRESCRIRAARRLIASAGGKAFHARQRPQLDSATAQQSAGSQPSISRQSAGPQPTVSRQSAETVNGNGKRYGTVQAFNVERLTRTVSPHEKASTEETRFLAELAEAFARWSPTAASQELTNWGGWWRKAFRSSPDKAGRVLAEINSMIRERRILKSPGRAAADLWKRLPD
jgi:hypothetical protein